MKTKHIQFTRGQTYSFTVISRDDRNVPRDLTDAVVYLAVRADIKVAPSVQLTSDATPVSGWRTGVVIADQAQYPGQYTVTFVPSDFGELSALGHDDPWIYDVRIVMEDGSVVQDISLSNLDLYPEITNLP